MGVVCSSYNEISVQPTHRTLLIVDDEMPVLRSLERALHRETIDILLANSGREGMEMVKSHDIGVVLSDQMMPEMDGVTFLSRVRDYDPQIVRLLLTGHASIDSAIKAINQSQIFEYLTKPWETNELKCTLQRAFEHYRLYRENQRLHQLTQNQNRDLRELNNNLEFRVEERTQQLWHALRDGILMLSLAAEARDDITGKHVQRIRQITKRICKQIGLQKNQIEQISFFSMMHDVGKIHISDSILKKGGALSAAEMQIMKSHTLAGEKILGNNPYYAVARQIARSHHEWWDGSGYPDGLKAEQIPLPARIVAVADVYDALTERRPYKAPWPKDKAINEIMRLAGRQFDHQIVNAFMQVTVNRPQEAME